MTRLLPGKDGREPSPAAEAFQFFSEVQKRPNRTC